MIIAGYPGIGKSTLAGKDHRFIDLESSSFITDIKRALDWYKPYCKVAEDLSRQGYIVFVPSHSVVIEELEASQEIVAVVYPSVDLKDEWIAKLKERYLKTMSTKDFSAYSRALWHYADDIAEMESCSKVDKICLCSMEYNLEQELSWYSSTFTLGSAGIRDKNTLFYEERSGVMKHIIVRKPKFMRSDAAMQAYMLCAEAYSTRLGGREDLTLDERYEMLKKVGECINKAAKAGGFLRTKDFLTWMDDHKATA